MADTLRDAGGNGSQPDDINDAIDELLDTDLMDNYAEEFAHLLDLLKQRMDDVDSIEDDVDSRTRLIEADGNTAVAVPEYDSLNDSEMQALADETNSDEVAMVVINGEAGILED